MKKSLLALLLLSSVYNIVNAQNTGNGYDEYIKGNAALIETKPDTVAAVKLFKAAAQKGSVPAAAALARLYETGSGVKQDYTEALLWYKMLGTDYESRARKRMVFAQAAKSSGKPLVFSSIHNFKGAFLPGYNKIVLNAAYDYDNIYDKLQYTAVDYRIIDLKTMRFDLISAPYSWNDDAILNRKSNGTDANMMHMAAYEPGTAPDSLRHADHEILKNVMKTVDEKYSGVFGRFISQLNDGSLIYAVVNEKSGGKAIKNDVEIYRQPSVYSTVLEPYFVIKDMAFPKPDIVISEDGKKVMYLDYGYGNRCPVYDIPSKKKIAVLDLSRGELSALLKFTPNGDSLVICRQDLMQYWTMAIRGKGSSNYVHIPIKDLDENSEEYGFNEDEKYANVKRTKYPFIMDYTPDCKQFLVATSNKVAIISMDGSPAKFISTPGINLQYVVAQRVYTDDVYRDFSANRTALLNKVRDESYRRQQAERLGRSREAEERRMANEKAIADYRRAHPFGSQASNPSNTSTPSNAAQQEAERHSRAMNDIYRSTEKMQSDFAKKWKE
jgi:hypothetical protein